MKQLKLTKIINKLLAILLIVCIFVANYAVVEISIAETDLISETATRGSKIEFNAYFKLDDRYTTRQKRLQIEEGGMLCLKINVADKVALSDGIISMEDANFKIVNEGLAGNKYISAVNTETNQIKLTKISSNELVVIEIPIEFKKQDRISVDYLKKETKIVLEGKYEDVNKRQKNYKGESSVKPRWVAKSDVKLSQSIDKYFGLEENGTLLEQKVTTEVENNTLPRDKEMVEVTVPEIKGERPNWAIVLIDGRKATNEEMQYDAETGTIKIVSTNNQDSEGKIAWQSKPVEYTVIYNYPANLATEETTIKLGTKSHTYLYSNTSETTKEIEEEVTIAPVGSLATVKTNLYGELYKGYLYHNEDKKIEYKEKNDIEVSYKEGVEKLELKVSDIPNITYKQTEFNKEELKRILGEEFIVRIKNEAGEEIAQINKDSETNENGIITIQYNEGQAGVVIETTSPQLEGVFTVLNTKEINCKTDQDIATLRNTKTLTVNTELSTNLSKETNSATIELKEPTSEAKLTSNITKISTLKPTNVEINAVLLSNNEKQELYKNPTLQIKLPEQIEDVKINTINKLYADEFEFGRTRLLGTTQRKIIDIKLVGEQTEHLNSDDKGIQVVINADLTPTQKSQNVTSNISKCHTQMQIQET